MNVLKEEIILIFTKYKKLLWALGIVCLLSYGYTITHHSIGVDNNAYGIYFEQFGLISQGRLTGLLLDKLTGIFRYTPFWANAFGVIILYTSTILWCALFIKVGKGKITQGACIVFSTILVSFPIINEHFIFSPFDYPLGYGLIAIALVFLYEMYRSKKYIYGLFAVLSLIVILSLNESFAGVYLCGIFMIMIVQYIANKGAENKFSDNLRLLISGLILIIIAFAIEFGLGEVAKIIVPNHYTIPASNRSLWSIQPVLMTAKNLFWSLYYDYIVMAKHYFPITILAISGALSAIIAVVYSIKRKKPILLLLFLGLYLSIISLQVVAGTSLAYRTFSSSGLFVSFVFLVLWMSLKSKPSRIIAGIIIFILVLNQSRIMTEWFYNDYMRYEYDKEIVLNVSNEIEKNHDKNKPVVFIGWVKQPPNVKQIEGEYNGVSFVGNYTDYREHKNMNRDLLFDFFKIHGHEFNIATNDQYEKAKLIASDMDSYPNDGYIFEEEEFIIVNFN